MSKQTIISSFTHAINGLFFTIKTQRNMKLHLLAATVSIGLGFYVTLSLVEWGLLSLCIGLVLVTETINTAIEESVNLVTKEYNEHAKYAKDTAAGATLLASCVAGIIGCILFIPKIAVILEGQS